MHAVLAHHLDRPGLENRLPLPVSKGVADFVRDLVLAGLPRTGPTERRRSSKPSGRSARTRSASFPVSRTPLPSSPASRTLRSSCEPPWTWTDPGRSRPPRGSKPPQPARATPRTAPVRAREIRMSAKKLPRDKAHHEARSRAEKRVEERNEATAGEPDPAKGRAGADCPDGKTQHVARHTTMLRRRSGTRITFRAVFPSRWRATLGLPRAAASASSRSVPAGTFTRPRSLPLT